jgi:hypothetical protein
MTGRRQTWKACWVHALAGSNPASSAGLTKGRWEVVTSRLRLRIGRTHAQTTGWDGSWARRTRQLLAAVPQPDVSGSSFVGDARWLTGGWAAWRTAAQMILSSAGVCIIWASRFGTNATKGLLVSTNGTSADVVSVGLGRGPEEAVDSARDLVPVWDRLRAGSARASTSTTSTSHQ